MDRVNLTINLLVSLQKEGDLGLNSLRARRVSQHQAELILITEWISTCKRRHKDCHHKLWQRTISIDELRLRVIDVQDCCIIAAPKDCEYIALSYVWGKAPMPKTVKANFTTSSLPQGLDLTALPQTISDAVEVVRAIGLRYLWVDALCIIQDDEEDKLHQIGNMNLVYGLACFTIIAADGEGADAGLVGVKSGSRNIVQDIEEVEPDLHLAVSLGGFGPHRRALSKWNTRAWTFQEALLSPRMVIFTGGEMTWECREAVWAEDLHVSPSAIGSFATPHFSNSMTPLLEGRRAAMKKHPSVDAIPFTAMRLDNLTVYENAVRDYTARAMTYPTDGLNAFAGLAKTFETTLATTFSQGLPQNRLDTALLWTPEQALQRRPAAGFASWSWVGWIGKSRYFTMNPNVIKPTVRFYKTRENSTLNRLPQEWEEENYKPSIRPWRVVKSDSPTTLPTPHQPETSPLSSHSLCFYALAASSEHFRLELLKSPLPRFVTLYDHAGRGVGGMGLDSGVYPDIGKYSLIGLSQCSHHVQQEGLGCDLPTMITPSTLGGEGYNEVELLLFNVMLVGWTGGVCERVGLGWMQKADFWKAKPERTWVVLQ